jgi:hypothetical protein
MKMEKRYGLRQLTDIFATCRRCGDPVLTSLDTVTEAEWVVVFTYNLASAGFYSLDGASRGSRRYYVNGCFETVGALVATGIRTIELHS